MRKETKEEALEEILEDLESQDRAEKEEKDKAGDEKKSAEPEEKGGGGDEEKDVAEEKEPEAEDAEEKDEVPDRFKKKLDELQDKYVRQVAEFDNFRKRSEREKSQMFEQGQMNVLEKLLPVIDNFERGLDAAPPDEASKAFVDGMQMIYKQITKMMEDLDVKPIEALGNEFDPNFHNAVMQVESEEYETGTVAQEMQKGYMFHDSVLRHSMVAVVQ